MRIVAYPGMRLAMLLGCMLHLVGCQEMEDYRNGPARIAELQGRVAKLEATVSALTLWDVGRMRQELSTARTDIALLKLNADGSRYAELGVGEQGFQRVDSSTGSFFVSLRQVSAFADGSRLVLHVGNPSAATYDGLQAEVRYGRRLDEASDDDYVAWRASLKDASVKLPVKLLPGTWNRVTLNLPGTKPDALGYLQLSLSTDSVILRSP